MEQINDRVEERVNGKISNLEEWITFNFAPLWFAYSRLVVISTSKGKKLKFTGMHDKRFESKMWRMWKLLWGVEDFWNTVNVASWDIAEFRSKMLEHSQEWWQVMSDDLLEQISLLVKELLWEKIEKKYNKRERLAEYIIKNNAVNRVDPEIMSTVEKKVLLEAIHKVATDMHNENTKKINSNYINMPEEYIWLKYGGKTPYEISSEMKIRFGIISFRTQAKNTSMQVALNFALEWYPKRLQ